MESLATFFLTKSCRNGKNDLPETTKLVYTKNDKLRRNVLLHYDDTEQDCRHDQPYVTFDQSKEKGGDSE